jgi:two-component system sensor histidine kinase BaeS
VKKIKFAFPIGLRLFFAVLLAILVVAASGIGLLRQRVLGSFSDYAVQIELDRLGTLANALGRQYRDAGGWAFIPQAGKAGFIVAELDRLARAPAAGNAPEALPPLPLPPLPPEPPEPEAAPAARPSRPAPPAPPAPPVAPSPPSPVAPATDVDDLGLRERISLLDSDGNWLAGRVPGKEPAARRPVIVQGVTVGHLQVARTLKPSDAMALAFLDQLGQGMALIVAASILLSAVAAVILARHFRKPIHTLAAGAGQLARGDFSTRIHSARSDELGDLARAFNQLAERLAEAEDSRRQWVADTSHELRTPLAVLRAQLEAIQDGVRPADPATVAAMLRQVLALNTLIDELYALSRADAGELGMAPAAVDAWQLACDCAQAFADRIQAAGLTLSIGAGPSVQVQADPARLSQVYGNLLENSVRYTSGGGTIALGARASGGMLEVWIDDSAPGVPDAALARLSERFYRVDASRSRAHGGAGLGLSVCERIVSAHGGTLSFSHSPLGGLRALLALPIR